MGKFEFLKRLLRTFFAFILNKITQTDTKKFSLNENVEVFICYLITILITD